MAFIRDFSQLGKEDASVAGGKGASLGEMTSSFAKATDGQGYRYNPVPPGFVVLASAFEKFLDETDLHTEIDTILHTVKTDEMRSVEHASEKIQKLILEAKMPRDIGVEIKKSFITLDTKYVAVRSSATAEDSNSAAWAGQLDTFLNTTEENLLENVQKCWASLFTSRAIFYRFEKGMHLTKISVAVVVQKMIQSEISGIAFSVHPVTEDKNQLIIEAGYGLGEAIVSGQITPDSYVVEKSPRRIIDTNIAVQERGIFRKQEGGNEWKNIELEKGSKQKLTDKQILELSELIIKIENHYGFPCDIEWALEKNVFYITQSRPITTLSSESKPSARKKVILSKIFSRERPFFYFCMWHDSNTMGFKRFVQFEVENSLFLRKENNNKVSVWYNQDELKSLDEKTAKRVNEDPKVFSEMFSTLDEEWKHIGSLLTGERKLKSIEDLDSYYPHLTKWWSAMTVVFNIPGISAVKEDMRNQALARRMAVERYSDAMYLIYLDFWKENFPDFFDIAYVILPDEAVRLGRGELSEVDLKKIRARLSGFALFNNKVCSLTELEALLKERHIALEKQPMKNKMKRIKGAVAYPGLVVQGKIRLIRLREQIATLQEGEILVTEMTDPDFVPAMKKAKAIITDEGGVMCHAAIVARELKKPCIIGTKIATQVLKDGDMVEVDADKGVITILKRAK